MNYLKMKFGSESKDWHRIADWPLFKDHYKLDVVHKQPPPFPTHFLSYVQWEEPD